MPSDWEPISLREAGVTLIDCDHRTPPAVDSGLPYVSIPQLRQGRIEINNARKITAEHFEEWTRKAKPQVYDVVLSRRCNPGETAFVSLHMEFALGQNLVLLRADGSKVYPPFLRWLVRSPDWWGEVGRFINVGAIFNSLKCADIPKFSLPIPDIPEQISIAHTLGALDDKIALLRETNSTLEAIAQALFKSWFVDFDPVRAKRDGRDPEGIPPEVADLFPSEFEDSTLGVIPKGWRQSSIGQSFILTMGQSPPGETYNTYGEGLPFYQGRTDFGFRFPEKRVFCTAPTRLAEVGDTLVSVRAPVGDVNMALEPCCLGRGVAAVRHPMGYRSFTFYALRGLRSRFDLHDKEGTVFGSINKKDFELLPVIEPTQAILEAFNDLVSPLDTKIVENEGQVRTLTTLRDTLLPRLMSGKLRIPETMA